METEGVTHAKLSLIDMGYQAGAEGILWSSREDITNLQVFVFPVIRGPRKPILPGVPYRTEDTHIVIKDNPTILEFGTDIQVLTDITQAQWHRRFLATGPGYVLKTQNGGIYFLPSIYFDMIGPITNNHN